MPNVFDYFRSPDAKRTKSIGGAQDSETKSDNMQRGMKRKADPYDLDVDDDEPSLATPAARSRPRRPSEAPSSTKSRQSTGKIKRQSVGKRFSLASTAAAAAQSITASQVDGDDEEPPAIRAPVADMGGAELLERQPDNEEQPVVEQKPVPKDKVTAKPKSGVKNKSDAEKKPVNAKTFDDPTIEQDAEVLVEKKILDENIHEIKKLVKHAVSDDEPGRIVLLVQWVDDPKETWEPEEEIQDGASEMLFDYWKKQGGRNHVLFDTKPLLKEQYWVYKILKHERFKSTFRFQIQWVGYPVDGANTTWESESKLKNIAPELLDEYWTVQGGRDKFLAKRGRAKKARTE
ncbi:hypothetical protein SCAR479_05295 [Seiridium cardinale]|uniref:Chromo domain-containing protein n=1 Tax=Seiridium cardinale TaxID=138064 RepID=A0ABR2XWE3_9PEZI